jgi:hypothetical protein
MRASALVKRAIVALRKVAHNGAMWYWLALTAIPGFILALFFGLGYWFLFQVRVTLQSMYTFPLTPDLRKNEHIEATLLVSFAAMATLTWGATNSQSWKRWFVDRIFLSEWQKVLFGLLFMRSLEDSTIDKTMHIAVVVWAAG